MNQALSPRQHEDAQIDIGIEREDREQISHALGQVLADSFTLYLRTHQFHWNVTGPMFNSLHEMFMQQYTEQWSALDEIAERIRALGFHAPGSLVGFEKLSTISDKHAIDDDLAWQEMVKLLVNGNEGVCRSTRKALVRADEAGDEGTCDLMTQRLKVHEKNAWMLRALLQ